MTAGQPLPAILVGIELHRQRIDADVVARGLDDGVEVGQQPIQIPRGADDEEHRVLQRHAGAAHGAMHAGEPLGISDVVGEQIGSALVGRHDRGVRSG